VADRRLRIWYDREGDFLEVIFEDRAGSFRETQNDQVMEKVDEEGHVIGHAPPADSALSDASVDAYEPVRIDSSDCSC